MKKRILIYAITMAAACFVPSQKAWPGYTLSSPLYCTTSGPGAGGTCTGTMMGIRNSQDSTDYAVFYFRFINNVASRGFSAFYNQNQMGCTVPESSPFATDWNQVVMHATGSFHVSWNPNGECTNIGLINGSTYSNY